MIEALRRVGFDISYPKATFYIWVPVPQGFTSMGFAKFILERAQVVVTPGIGFGKYGEGFVRISITTPTNRLKEAMERITHVLGG